MPANVIGDIKDHRRIITGMYTLDRAFEHPQQGQIGVPMSIIELFGPTGCGKTTMSWLLVVLAAKMLHKNIVMLNIETFDPHNLKTVMDFYGFDGDIFISGGETDEEMISQAERYLRKEDYCAYVLDSIGAISPISELEGDVGAANMGRRARLVNPHVRKLGHYDRTKDILAVLINHVHPRIGGVGTTTPGGETAKFMSACRVRVKKVRDNPYKDGSFVIEGKVIKNRFGVENRLFWVFVLGGIGVHVGLSAVYDCIQLGLLKKNKSERSYRWLTTDEKIPSYSALIEAAREGNREIFTPFTQALLDQSPVAVSKDDGTEDE